MLDVKYDIVGSFLRPEVIKEARGKYKEGSITLEELRQIEDIEIAKLVKKQVDHGLKFVTDGEFRRRWWHLDWLKEFNGFTTEYLSKELNGLVNEIELGYINGKVSYNLNRSHPEIEAYDFLHKETLKYPSITPKKCISGPNMILVDNYLQLGLKDLPYYADDIDSLIEDIGLAYQADIKDLYDHGCRYLQIDDTSWTYLIDENFLSKINKLGYEKDQVLEWFKRVSTKALENKPKDMTIGTHFCKGNFKGNPLFHGFYDSVAPIISEIPYDLFFVEYDDERSGSFGPWSVFKGKDAKFIVGLISTKNPELESHEEIKERFLEAKSIIGENIGLSPQCGFASVEEGNSIDEVRQWEKIDLLVSCKDFL